jgi:NADPH:quinone reductase-like Zn-dependent oxidoreductase
LKSGNKVLIHAGSGGVGTLAIQIAKHFGAHVATTCSPRNADLARDLGADVVIDYKTEAFDEVLSEYDIVFDMMGGETLNRSFKVLTQGGTLVSIKGQNTESHASEYGVRFEWFFMEPDSAMLADLGALIEQGAVKPVTDSVYPVNETAKACEALKDGHALGKIVITVS